MLNYCTGSAVWSRVADSSSATAGPDDHWLGDTMWEETGHAANLHPQNAAGTIRHQSDD